MSLVEELPAPRFHQCCLCRRCAEGEKALFSGRGPTQLRPSTRKDTQMAKSTAKPGSIPSYVKELQKLSAELKAAEEERAQLEAQWRQKYM
jgi:hypothetical protein